MDEQKDIDPEEDGEKFDDVENMILEDDIGGLEGEDVEGGFSY